MCVLEAWVTMLDGLENTKCPYRVCLALGIRFDLCVLSKSLTIHDVRLQRLYPNWYMCGVEVGICFYGIINILHTSGYSSLGRPPKRCKKHVRRRMQVKRKIGTAYPGRNQLINNLGISNTYRDQQQVRDEPCSWHSAHLRS
jgi:hypothetical protein